MSLFLLAQLAFLLNSDFSPINGLKSIEGLPIEQTGLEVSTMLCDWFITSNIMKYVIIWKINTILMQEFLKYFDL